MTQVIPFTYAQFLRRMVNKGFRCGDCQYEFVDTDYVVFWDNQNNDGLNHIKCSDWNAAYWIVAHCPNCSYDWAIWKLIQTNKNRIIRENQNKEASDARHEHYRRIAKS